MSAENLIKEYETQKEALKGLLGETKYDQELEILKKVQAQEEQKGVFQTIMGDIDDRPVGLKDITLNDGFETMCGLKGSKLSGGQK